MHNIVYVTLINENQSNKRKSINRHMFRSSESYSFSLELETAIAEALKLTSSLLTNQIIRHPVVPSLFHSEFDNFDQLLNDLTGKDSIHTSHGIMLQELPGGFDHGGDIPDMPTVEKNKHRSFKLDTAYSLP